MTKNKFLEILKEERTKKLARTLCQPFITPLVCNFIEFDSTLERAYVKHEAEPSELNSIYVLIRKDPLKYSRVRASLILLDLFSSEMATKNKEYTIFKFTVPSEFKEDYKLIIRGQYSRISKKLKNIIMKNNNLIKNKNIDKSSKLYKVLWRHPLYKRGLEKSLGVNISDDAELWDRPDILGNETFKESYLLE